MSSVSGTAGPGIDVLDNRLQTGILGTRLANVLALNEKRTYRWQLQVAASTGLGDDQCEGDNALGYLRCKLCIPELQFDLPTENLNLRGLTLGDHSAQGYTDDVYLTRLLPAHKVKKRDSILGHTTRASGGIGVSLRVWRQPMRKRALTYTGPMAHRCSRRLCCRTRGRSIPVCAQSARLASPSLPSSSSACPIPACQIPVSRMRRQTGSGDTYPMMKMTFSGPDPWTS